MKMEITVTEVRELINEIRQQPGALFDMIRVNVQETDRAVYVHTDGIGVDSVFGEGIAMNVVREKVIIAIGSYPRDFTLKGIGEVGVKVPRDRNGEFSTQVIPRSIQYEDAIREDLCTMFLAGVSTRTLSMMSERLIGRSISATKVSESSKALTQCCGTMA